MPIGESGATGGAPAELPASLQKIAEALNSLTVEENNDLVGWLTGAKSKIVLKDENSVQDVGDNPEGSQQRRDGAANPLAVGQQNRHMDDSKISKLAKFSGTPTKNEPSFRVWKFEVENLKGHYRDHEVVHAIHRSVTGMAAEVLMRMGRNVTLDQILQKFEHVFGSVSSQEKLLTDFYTAQQKSTESIAEWSCRLEDVLSHHQLSQLPQRDAMLKSKFFHGLHLDKIKNAVRHKFEGGTYEELLVLAREAEEEDKSAKAVAKPQVEDVMTTKLNEIMKELKDIKGKTTEWENRLQKMETTGKGNYSNYSKTYKKPNSDQQQDSTTHGDQQTLICNYCKAPGHTKKYCKKLNAKRSAAEARQ